MAIRKLYNNCYQLKEPVGKYFINKKYNEYNLSVEISIYKL